MTKNYNLPLDRGWAWMIIVGDFLVFMIASQIKSFGILFVEFIDRFDATAAQSGTVIGVYLFIARGMGLFSSGIASIYGARPVVIVGGLFTSIGWFAGSYGTRVDHIIICNGAMLGFGVGCCLSPGLIVVGHYFERYRPIANALANLGNSLSTLCFPLLLRYLLDNFGLRGTMWICSGLSMHLLVAAAIFRPFSFYGEKTEPVEKRLVDGEKDELFKLNVPERQTSSHSQVDSIQYGLSSQPELTRSMLSLRSESPSFCDVPEASASESQAPKQSRFRRLWHDSVAVLKDPLYISIMLATVFGSLGNLGPFVILQHYARLKGLSASQQAWLVTIIGIGDIIGRLGGGVFDNLSVVRTHLFLAFASLTLCALNVSALFLETFVHFIVFSILFGMASGVMMLLPQIIFASYLGVANLAACIGFTAIFMAVGYGVLPTLLGSVYDASNSYSAGFLLIAGSCAISTFISLFPVTILHRRRTIHNLASVSSHEQ